MTLFTLLELEGWSERHGAAGASLLNQIVVVGHDGADRLPPLELSYTGFQPEDRGFFAVQGQELPARPLGDPHLEPADRFGNGLPDFLETAGTMRYWRNLGGGQFDLLREMGDAPGGLALADPDVQIVDADGDGRPNLLVARRLSRRCRSPSTRRPACSPTIPGRSSS